MSVIEWLLEGDVCIRFLTNKYLLDKVDLDLQKKMESEGIVYEYLKRQDPTTKMWGGGVYTPKYISTHYTMLDLYHFEIDPQNQQYQDGARVLMLSDFFQKGEYRHGAYKDLCVAAMIGSIVTYGQIKDVSIHLFVDHVIKQVRIDGGWNCMDIQSEKSSIHTTLSVLIFIHDYDQHGYTYRLDELLALVEKAEEYILIRKLMYRLKDGELILSKIKSMPYPTRYQYDVLRALEYFVSVGHPYDTRMDDAINYVKSKKNKNDHYPIIGNYPGKKHFEVDNRRDSRFNTLRVLRVLKAYPNVINN